MWIVGLLMLVALGVLGVASWLKSKKPEAAGPLAQLEGVSGWVGLVGLVWGVFGLIQWIGAMGAISVAPVMIDQISIGDITVRNVKGVVTERGQLGTTLLGMSFLGRLSRAEMRRGSLVMEE